MFNLRIWPPQKGQNSNSPWNPCKLMCNILSLLLTGYFQVSYVMTYLCLRLIANKTLELVYENAPECTIFKWKKIPPWHLRHLDSRALGAQSPCCFFVKSNTEYGSTFLPVPLVKKFAMLNHCDVDHKCDRWMDGWTDGWNYCSMYHAYMQCVAL